MKNYFYNGKSYLNGILILAYMKKEICKKNKEGLLMKWD